MKTPRKPDEELERLLEGSGRSISVPLRSLAKVLAERLSGAAPGANVFEYEKALAQAIQRVLVETALRGATTLARKAKVDLSNPPRGAPEAGIPALPHLEAIRDLVSRQPVLARTAEKIARIYTEDHGFALARSASRVLTERIQTTIVGALRVGLKTPTATAIIRELGDFERSYAETVFRTNVSTAYTNGLVEIAKDPAVADVVSGFRFSAVHDSDVRPNHLAADGVVAAANDPVWNTLRPPLGFNCRCALELVSAVDRGFRPLPRARVPVGAYPDPGFRSGRNPAL